MAYTPPTTEPTELRAGDTWAWTRSLAAWPASVWTLTYHLRSATAHLDVVATADGDDFAVSVAKATTAGYAQGWYDWVAEVTDGTSRHEVGRGRLRVLPDYSAAAALDGRSFARQMVDYIEAALLDRASSDQLDVINASLADRSLSRDKAGLITLRSHFLAEAKREEHTEALRRGEGGRNRLLVRFGP
jgi:hypothetical protein